MDWRVQLSTEPNKPLGLYDLLAPVKSRSGTELKWDVHYATKAGILCTEKMVKDDTLITSRGQTFDGQGYERLKKEQCPEWGNRGFIVSEGMYLNKFFQPSATVREEMLPVQQQLKGHFTMSVQIRTTMK